MFWLSNDDIGYVCISFIDYKIKKYLYAFTQQRLVFLSWFCNRSNERTLDGLKFNLRCGIGGHFQATERAQIPKCWIPDSKIGEFSFLYKNFPYLPGTAAIKSDDYVVTSFLMVCVLWYRLHGTSIAYSV